VKTGKVARESLNISPVNVIQTQVQVMIERLYGTTHCRRL